MLGCGEAPPAAPGAPPLPSVASPRTISTDAAFALAPTSEGAILVWGSDFGVRVLSLDPRGHAAEGERTVSERGRVIEVEAASSGRRAGVAWVLDHGERFEAWSAFSPDAGRRFAGARELGPSVALEPGTRGRLAMAALDGGALSVQHRAPPGPCSGALDRSCALLYRHVLGDSDRQRQRGDEPLEVEHPCDPLIGSALFRAGTWYHAICHADPTPSSTIYVIRNEISWASTFDLEGCGAARLAPVEGGVVATARCPSGLRAVTVDEMGREQFSLHGARASARCEAGRPVLVLSDGSTQLSLQLGEARDHLESLLPETIAPSGARAIWTGEALLVASSTNRGLVLRRYACVGPALEPR